MKEKILVEKLKNRGIRPELLTRLSLVLAPPVSFDELEAALPPAIRYLGPGIWAETIDKIYEDGV
jgi:hypothetical protein